MNFGKAAYTKVLEIERKLGAGDISHENIGVYESSTIENLSVDAGNYTVDFGALEPTAEGICFLIKGDVESKTSGDISFTLFCGEEAIETKSFEGVLGQFTLDISKVYASKDSSVPVWIEISSTCDFVIRRMSLICINANGANDNSSEQIELKAVKTPDETFIISYTKNTQVYACEVNPEVSLEMNFLKVMDGVVSHAFAFDKSGVLLLFYVTTSGDLFLRKVGSEQNDVRVLENSSCVSAVMAPENVSADVLVCAIVNNKMNVCYFSIKSDVVSESQYLAVPQNKTYEDISLVSAENFAYVVVTASTKDNYILKSAFEPLSGAMFDTIECGYVLTARKYNTIIEDKSEAAERIVAGYTLTSEATMNFGEILQNLSVSHIKASYDICAESYSAAPAGVLYTMIIDKYNSDPETRCVYADDAEGLTPMRNVLDSETGSYDKLEENGWLSRWPFTEIKPCVIEDGKFIGYLNPNDYKYFETGEEVGTTSSTNYYDVMIEIPKIYYCIETIDDKIYVRISNNKLDERFKCYAHVYDGVELDKIYVAAYHSISKSYNGVNTFFSASGFSIDVMNIAYDNYHNYLDQKSSNYRVLSFDQFVLIQCLFLIAVKSTNSHTSYARGMNSSSRALTGAADTKGMYYGDTSVAQSMKFLGLENIIGNVAERVEGIAIRCLPTYDTYSLLRRNPYSTTPISVVGDGYDVLCTNPELDSVRSLNQYLVNPYGTTEAGFLPQSTTLDGTKGSSSTYFCDAVDFYNGYGIYMGGCYSSTTKTGIFAYFSERGSRVSGNWRGYRLVYHPTEGVN